MSHTTIKRAAAIALALTTLSISTLASPGPAAAADDPAGFAPAILPAIGEGTVGQPLGIPQDLAPSLPVTLPVPIQAPLPFGGF
jgi:hypothetical protein